MNWMSELVDLYDKNQSQVGKITYVGKDGDKPVTLMPIAHTTVNVDIEIRLNLDGKLVGVEPLDSEKTIIPATIESASRSGSKFVPMAVDDKLQYIAQDYNKLQKALGNKENGAFDKYIQQLTEFIDFTEERAKKVAPIFKAIQKYVENHDLVQDLMNSGQFCDKPCQYYSDLDMKSQLTKNVFCRFNVLTDEPERWRNVDCFNAWVDFYQEKISRTGQKGFDYVTGKDDVLLTSSHPKGILPIASNAKLISANDTTNFTFRGRFENSDEAVTISYESTQKAHAALKWLLAKQGYPIGGRYYLAWGTAGQNLTLLNPSDNDLFIKIYSLNDDQREDTNSAFASQLRNLLFKGADLKGISIKDPVFVMQLESATPGRFGIVYYQALDLTTYINRISDWYAKLSLDSNLKKSGYPSLGYIVNRIYGNRDDETIQKQKRDAISNLVQSILGGRNISYSYLSKIYQRAIRPATFKNTNNDTWIATVTTAARLFKSYYFRKEIRPMLNTEFKDRSYLYGRLLAVADVIEQGVLGANNQERLTNAQRYMSSFSQRPEETWRVIYVNLQSYLIKSSYKRKAQQLFDEINEKLDVTDPYLNSPLDGKFLIGFSQQRTAWYQSNKDKNKAEQVK